MASLFSSRRAPRASSLLQLNFQGRERENQVEPSLCLNKVPSPTNVRECPFLAFIFASRALHDIRSTYQIPAVVPAPPKHTASLVSVRMVPDVCFASQERLNSKNRHNPCLPPLMCSTEETWTWAVSFHSLSLWSPTTSSPGHP